MTVKCLLDRSVIDVIGHGAFVAFVVLVIAALLVLAWIGVL